METVLKKVTQKLEPFVAFTHKKQSNAGFGKSKTPNNALVISLFDVK